MSDHECPTEEQLYAILAGEEDHSTRAHIEQCEACRAQLQKLKSEATILRHVGERSLRRTEDMAPLPFPAVIGKFIIVGIWDDNPWFVTYRGLHAVVRSEVLIQVAKKSLCESSDYHEAFRAACAKWMQPRSQVAQLLDAGEFDSRPYLVVEFHDGVRLDRLIGQQLLDGSVLMQIFGKIAKALASDDVPHPRLQPSSIVVDEANQPTLVDWAASAEFDSTCDNDSASTRNITARRLAVAFCAAVLPEAHVTTSVSAIETTGPLTESLIAQQIPTAVAELMGKAVTAESNFVPSLPELAAVLIQPGRKHFWKRLFK